MRINFPSGVRSDIYDRNALPVFYCAELPGTAPHADTIQIGYTVPAGRRALITCLYVDMLRATVGGVSGLRAVRWVYDNGVDSGPVMELKSTDNTAGHFISQGPAQGLIMSAGENINLHTFDLSTGGTISYTGTILILEFDE